MINNNITKVSLSLSKANFTKLRKYNSGGSIPKFQNSTTEGGILYIDENKTTKGITHKEGTRWKTHVFDLFMEELVSKLQTAQTRELKLQIVNAINEMQQKYADLRHKYPNLTPVQFDLAVKQYQQDIIDKYPYVNTLGINYGLLSDTQRYIKPNGANTADRGGGNGSTWTTDGRWSGMTFDRTLLGWEGDYEDNELADWKKRLNSMGYDINLLSTEDNADRSWDKAYRLSLLPEDDELSEDNELPNNTAQFLKEENFPNSITAKKSIEFTPTATNYQPLEFALSAKRESSPWSDWLPLSSILGNNLANNVRLFNDETKKRFPLVEAPYLQGKVTDNYAERLARNNIAASIRSRSNQNLSSNLEANLAQQYAADALATNLENQNELAKTLEFNATSLNLQNISNLNKIQGVLTANENSQRNAAAWNNILAARQKLNASNTAELNSYIGNMYTSHGQWLLRERMEDNRFLQGQNLLDYQNAINNAYTNSGLKKMEEGIRGSQQFKDFLTWARDPNNSEFQLGAGYSDDDYNNDDKMFEWFTAHKDDDGIKDYYTRYAEDVANAEKRYEKALQLAELNKRQKDLALPGTVSNLGFRFLDYLNSKQRYKNPLYGKLGMKTRFIDYMNHYLKLQLFDRVELRKTNENILKKLKRDLDSLDKETLLLLRSIFK